MPIPQPKYLYGLHEEGGEFLFAYRKGWILFLAEIGHDPNDFSGRDFSRWANAGYGVITRVNHGYGTSGTIPSAEHHASFAKRFANFVAASKGCARWIVGNEPNHPQEWPDNVEIKPWRYADCFNQVAAAVHSLPGHAGDEVIAAAIAPWTDKAGDWIAYSSEMLKNLKGCDAIGLHAYTHGASPDLITSEEKMRDAPYQDRRAEFRAYQDTLNLGVPDHMKSLPCYMTEMNQIVVVDNKIIGWINANTGWVQAAYAEIKRWNERVGTQKIFCGCLYRWPNNDVWGLVNRDGVHADLRAAVARGYEVPLIANGGQMNTFIPFAGSGQPASPPPEVPLPPVIWDERLVKRGIELTQYVPKPGEWFWRLVKGEYWEEKEHIFVVTEDEAGVRKPGVGVRYWWADGKVDKKTELKPSDRWMSDFDMHAHGKSYGTMLLDGPSDSVWGCGLGSWQQPDWNIHVSYHFTWRWIQAPAAHVETPPAVPKTPVAQRYKLGDTVYTSGYTNLRRSPGYAGKPPTDVINTLEPGTPVKLSAGPRVVDDLVWWATSDHLAGWIAESDPSGALLLGDFVEPISNNVPILVHPIADTSLRIITQLFGVNEEYYKKFIYEGVPMLGHNGIDYGVPIGTPIRAVDKGTVIETANDADGYGIYVKLKHDWGETLYAHLSETRVNLGDMVEQGQVVGLSGWTGNVEPKGPDGAHLHFGLRVEGYNRADGYGGYSDPLAYLSPSPSTKKIDEMAKDAATEFNVDYDLLINLLFAENRFRLTGSSAKGAVGPAQIMPLTWGEWAGRIGAKNIDNPYDNIRVGAAYLAYLVKQFDGNILKALYAYNWGMGNVRSMGTPPMATQIYAYSIIHGAEIMKALRNL